MPDDDKLDSIIQRLAAVEAQVTIQSTEAQSANIASWIPTAFAQPGTLSGVVVDEGKARESDCRFIQIDDNSKLVYSPGIVGALGDDQQKLYCDTMVELQVPEETRIRQRILRDAAVICQSKVAHLPEGERLEAFMACLSQSAKKQGIEV